MRARPSLVRDAELRAVLIAIAAVATLGCVVAAGVALLREGGPPRAPASREAGESATAAYGRQLITETPRFLGPDHPDPARRYSGSRLSCGSCHLNGGATPGSLTLIGAAQRYPRFSGRDGGIGDIQDRLNGCMLRSMNGRPLPRDGVALRAMVAYIESLGDDGAARASSAIPLPEPPPFVEPPRRADVARGRVVFDTRCALCHGRDGAGRAVAGDPALGYVFPPLWGPDSFNDGAGMHRVLTAARFIKARMPLGVANLTDDEAFDVAAYINAQPRPAMANLDRDYPDRTTKPIDSPYPPYADGFSRDQHRFGPFAPIRHYYAALASRTSRSPGTTAEAQAR